MPWWRPGRTFDGGLGSETMGVSSQREKLLGLKPKVHPVDTATWPEVGEVFVRSMSGAEREAYLEQVAALIDPETSKPKAGAMVPRGLAARLAVACWVDKDGERVFQDDDGERVNGVLDARLLEVVMEKVIAVSGLGEGAEEAAKKD